MIKVRKEGWKEGKKQQRKSQYQNSKKKKKNVALRYEQAVYSQGKFTATL